MISKSITTVEDDVCEILYVDEPRVRRVEAQMPADETVEEVTEIFKTLSDPTRAKMIFALSQAELCVCDLAALVGLSVSAVSHQLRLLRSLRLVTYRKEGRLAYYSLDDDHTAQLLQDVLMHVQEQD